MGILGTSFIIQEFVPPHTWRKWGAKSIWFINPNIVLFAQWLKDHTNSIVIINDWAFGGQYFNSGFRPPDCIIGAALSQHRFGNGIDIKVTDYSANQIRSIIRENWKFLHDKFNLSTIEKNTPTWTHVDFRYTGLNYLYEVDFN